MRGAREITDISQQLFLREMKMSSKMQSMGNITFQAMRNGTHVCGNSVTN